jgi:hypothetical protein
MAPSGGRLSSHRGFHLGDTLSDAAALAAFAHGHLAFVLWLILYAVTPILVPALWLINRHADPGGAEAHDVRVPKAVRLGLGALGAGLLVFALAGWASPKWLMTVWPWALSPLTGRVMCGWLSLAGRGWVGHRP